MLLGVNNLTRTLRMPGRAIISWLECGGQWRGYDGATQNQERCAGRFSLISACSKTATELQHPCPRSSHATAQRKVTADSRDT